MEEKTGNVDVVSALRVLRRRWAWILLCVLVAAGAAYGFSALQRKEYTATASILFQNQQLQQQAAGLPGVAVLNPQSETDTNLKLATLPRIAAATAAVVGLGTTGHSIASDVSVSQEADTNLASVSATTASPRLSARVANKYAKQVIAYRQLSDGTFYTRALGAVNRQLKTLTPGQQDTVQGVDLRDRAASLQILAELQGSEVQLAQRAHVPTSPSSPKTQRNVALGALVGLLLGLGIAFGLERFDQRMREPSDLERAYGLPLVGVVPESAALKAQASDRKATQPIPEREAEIFGLLRAHIRYFNVDRNLQVVVVASAAPGDGKSTIARNLALAAARAGERVLFLEADFRRPAAAKTFGILETPGIAETLMRELPLDQAIQPATFDDRGGRKVTVDVLVAGGILPTNPGQVTESHAMGELLHQVRSGYDLIVVDTPPLAILSDAFPLLRAADGVLIVSRLGRNRRDVARRLRATLEAADVKMVGVVANGYRQRGVSPYGYGYGSRYEYGPTGYDLRPVDAVLSNGKRPDGASPDGQADDDIQEGVRVPIGAQEYDTGSEGPASGVAARQSRSAEEAPSSPRPGTEQRGGPPSEGSSGS